MVDFKQVLNAIEQIRKEIKGMTFEQAGKWLGGYNYDGTLFDYDWGIDSTSAYLVGTILNKKGKPYMPTDNNFYEVWDTPDEKSFAEQVLAMTEDELREQVKRLK